MSSNILNKFMYVESTQIPMVQVDYTEIKESIINPITGKPYKGVILFGVFADLSPVVNNNNRIYDIPKYLELLGELRKRVHSGRGVYGELEHPDRYSVDYKLVSHKILDVWYDESDMKVKGYILLLNDTPNGQIAMDIVKSGGQLAISARAAGTEIDQPDGTKQAVMKLLTTYDLVYHPGFSDAILEFKELNESEQFVQNISKAKQGYGYIIREGELRSLNEAFGVYMDIFQVKPTECFFEWYGSLNEDEKQTIQSNSAKTEQDKKDEEKMQDQKPADKQQVEKQLQISANADLSESDRRRIHKRLLKSGRQSMFDKTVGPYSELGRAVYDNSAGFVSMDL